jgi:soluble cytochrome b562
MLELYVPQGVDPDYDDYSKGTQMLVSAVKDADGDWVLSDDPEIQEAKKPKKTAAKKPKK